MHNLSNGRSIEELLEAVRPKLRGVVFKYRIPPQDAEDLMQNAFIQFLKKRTEVRNPETWLAGTLRFECLVYWRQRRRRVEDGMDEALLEFLADDAVPPQERDAMWHQVEETIESMKPRCRSMLRLRYRLGYNDSEIADRTGYQPQSVDKITRRCIAALSRRIVRVNLARNP